MNKNQALDINFADYPFWFSAVMQAASREIYLFDPSSLKLLSASTNALKILNQKTANIHALTAEDIFDEVSNSALQKQLIKLHGKKQLLELPISECSSKPANDSELKMLLVKNGARQVIVAIHHDQVAMKALVDSESRFQAIVSNIPGLVFECHFNHVNEIAFNYLSDRCIALLGIAPEALQQHPEQLIELVVAQDRASFLATMQDSAKNLSVWNWEGGIWIESWQDIKLINLRASAHTDARGVVRWGGTITNITQGKEEKRELEESHARLAELSSHMSLIKEQERLRIAREIHDDLGGNLTAIKIGLASLANKLGNHDLVLLEKARHLESIVDNTFNAAHKITSDLRPNVLELGIVAALEWQAKEFEKQMGIACTFTTNDEGIELNADQAIVLFRICQEATSNIAKYAQASRVKVQLFYNPDEVNMQIHDNGVGITEQDKLKKNAFGIRGMAERVTTLNGNFSIQAGKKKGTVILVSLPL